MSTSSKPKSRAPAHQNRTGFKHNKNSKKTNVIAASATTYGLCQKCSEKQQWRIKYRKYKPLKAPRKCNRCDQKTVKAAYRTMCTPCAGSAGVCAGCGLVKSVNTERPESSLEAQQDNNTVKGVIRGLRERQRRTVLRRADRGEDEVNVICDVLGEELTLESDSESEERSENDEDNDETDEENG